MYSDKPYKPRLPTMKIKNVLSIAAALVTIGVIISAPTSSFAQAPTRLPLIAKSERLIRIDLSAQQGTYSEDGAVVKTFRISSGTPEFPTPTGDFTIVNKGSLDGKSSTRQSAEFKVPMPWAMEISAKDSEGNLRGICLHAGKIPNYPSSHACVRLEESIAEFLYSRCSRDTAVEIEGSGSKFLAEGFEHRDLLVFGDDGLPRFKRNADGTLTEEFLKAYDQKVLKLCVLKRGTHTTESEDSGDWVIGWPFLERYTQCIPVSEYEKQTGRKVFVIRKK